MRAYVLHPDIRSNPERRSPPDALAEAMALAAAIGGIDLAGGEIVNVAKPRPGFLFGKGRMAEIGVHLSDEDIGLVLIDGPVSPVQQRNLERAWKVKILDRTGLILEIFADRARTREGVLQVDLAALEYQKTRLVRSWTHLERQRGGLGFVGGPGETQIEADRRALRDAIGRIRRQLAKVVRTRALHRAARRKVPYPVIALVGYTNAGKSTLFNRLTGAGVDARDMLFATLDPTMRAITLPSGREVILSDTVGFISELPTELVAAFRATLEEVLDADIICHVRDISHPRSAEQAADVHAILSTLGVSDERRAGMAEMWNKIDRVDAGERQALTAAAARGAQVVPASALTGEGVGALLAAFDAALAEPVETCRLHLGFGDGRKRAWLYEEGVVEAEAQTDDGYCLDVRWSAAQARRFANL